MRVCGMGTNNTLECERLILVFIVPASDTHGTPAIKRKHNDEYNMS